MKYLQEEQVAGIIVAILIFLILNYQEINSFLKKPIVPPSPYYANFCDFSSYSSDNAFLDAEKNNVYVPDYFAKIYINPTKEKFNADEGIEFSLRIEDKGIVNMTEPYFYIFLQNPSGVIKAVFPCFCGQDKQSFSDIFGGYSNYGCYSANSCFVNAKMKDWVSSTWTQNGQAGWSCSDKTKFCINMENTYCFSRNEFFNGTFSNNRPIIYRYPKLGESGTWKVFVFLFDKQYVNRKGEPLAQSYSGEDYNKNSIAYETANILVTSETPSVENPANINFGWFLYKIVSVIPPIFFYYGITRKNIYIKLKDFVGKNKNEIIGLLIFSLFIMIIIFFLCNTSCPLIPK